MSQLLTLFLFCTNKHQLPFAPRVDWTINSHFTLFILIVTRYIYIYVYILDHVFRRCTDA